MSTSAAGGNGGGVAYNALIRGARGVVESKEAEGPPPGFTSRTVFGVEYLIKSSPGEPERAYKRVNDSLLEDTFGNQFTIEKGTGKLILQKSGFAFGSGGGGGGAAGGPSRRVNDSNSSSSSSSSASGGIFEEGPVRRERGGATTPQITEDVVISKLLGNVGGEIVNVMILTGINPTAINLTTNGIHYINNLLNVAFNPAKSPDNFIEYVASRSGGAGRGIVSAASVAVSGTMAGATTLVSILAEGTRALQTIDVGDNSIFQSLKDSLLNLLTRVFGYCTMENASITVAFLGDIISQLIRITKAFGVSIATWGELIIGWYNRATNTKVDTITTAYDRSGRQRLPTYTFNSKSKVFKLEEASEQEYRKRFIRLFRSVGTGVITFGEMLAKTRHESGIGRAIDPSVPPPKVGFTDKEQARIATSVTETAVTYVGADIAFNRELFLQVVEPREKEKLIRRIGEKLAAKPQSMFDYVTSLISGTFAFVIACGKKKPSVSSGSNSGAVNEQTGRRLIAYDIPEWQMIVFHLYEFLVDNQEENEGKALKDQDELYVFLKTYFNINSLVLTLKADVDMNEFTASYKKSVLPFISSLDTARKGKFDEEDEEAGNTCASASTNSASSSSSASIASAGGSVSSFAPSAPPFNAVATEGEGGGPIFPSTASAGFRRLEDYFPPKKGPQVSAPPLNAISTTGKRKMDNISRNDGGLSSKIEEEPDGGKSSGIEEEKEPEGGDNSSTAPSAKRAKEKEQGGGARRTRLRKNRRSHKKVRKVKKQVRKTRVQKKRSTRRR